MMNMDKDWKDPEENAFVFFGVVDGGITGKQAYGLLVSFCFLSYLLSQTILMGLLGFRVQRITHLRLASFKMKLQCEIRYSEG